MHFQVNSNAQCPALQQVFVRLMQSQVFVRLMQSQVSVFNAGDPARVFVGLIQKQIEKY